ncbi:MAG: cation:dicarboxylase symporter family transporter, partial [Dermabacter sp.]|nr:cation:dicarboxylase symporter family transporter [Dermabacter sp.]MDU5962950.1 cation:dicarboxylase symporter family transporter [Dermabacter sp.]
MLRNYRFPLIILACVVLGAIAGLVFGPDAAVVKPFGVVFVNMMFTLVVPLVFFSIASSVAAMDSAKRLGKIMGSMMLVFISTGIVAAIIMLTVLWIFRSSEPLNITLTDPGTVEKPESIGDQIVQTLTVNEFGELLSPSNMLALIIFAVLVGFATSGIGKAGDAFRDFLSSASAVFLKLVSLIMYYAPIGLGAYFAALIGELGPQLVGGYVRAFVIYFPVTIVYFCVAFTLYAYIAGGTKGIKRFWSNILEPTAIALGTGSSVACLPANLKAA